MDRRLALCLMLIGVPVQAADLPKLRNLPVALPGLPAELIRQYEYNPDIGPYGTRGQTLLSITDQGGTTTANTWGADMNLQGGRYVALYIYRGFSTLSWNSVPPATSECGTQPSTSVPTQMKLIKNGPWPSASFKIYTEQADDRYALTCGYYKDGRRELTHSKTLLECTQQRVSSLDGLPGKVYAYTCDRTDSGDYEGANPTTQRGLRYLYSEYLDRVVAIRIPGLDEVTGRYRARFTFRAPGGGEQSVVVDNYGF